MRAGALLHIIVLIGGSQSASAATLICTSRSTTQSVAPSARITATLSASYLGGGELTELTRLKVVAAETVRIPAVKADAGYKPKKDLGFTRFFFDANASDRSSRGFDGIIHGMLLPKKLALGNVLKSIYLQGSVAFTGYIAASTNSYHDDTVAYFKASCTVRR